MNHDAKGRGTRDHIPIRGLTDEFPQGALDPPEVPSDPRDPSRRRFLALTAASTALAASLSCSRNLEEEEALPYTRKVPGETPGRPALYATSFQEGAFAYGILARVREGKPIHIEGNDRDPLHLGRAPFRAVADLYSLYDPDRANPPQVDGSPSSWEAAEESALRMLREASTGGRQVLVVAPPLLSPTRRALLSRLSEVLPGLRPAAWDASEDRSESSALRACYGASLGGDRRFDRARTILSLESDFLGCSGDAVRSARLFGMGRSSSEEVRASSRLWVLEGGLSLTGSVADRRLALRPSLVAKVPFVLARLLSEGGGIPLPPGFDASALAPYEVGAFCSEAGLKPADLQALADHLAQTRPNSLAVAGPALGSDAHLGTHLLNLMLGAIGTTLHLADRPGGTSATPEELQRLSEESAAGAFGAALFWGVNLAYEAPALWRDGFSKIPSRIHIGVLPDETAEACQVHLPAHHWLESWGDFQAGPGTLLLQQPACRPIFDTRQAEDLLLRWLGKLGGAAANQSYRELLKERWAKDAFEGGPAGFEAFWNACLHDGVLLTDTPVPSLPEASAQTLSEAARRASEKAPGGEVEALVHPSHKLLDGRYANNGWLQELPDPLTKTTWGSPARVSSADASRLGISDGDLVTLSGPRGSWTGPALVQPGQAPGVVSLATGYGRTSGSVASGVGVSTAGFFLGTGLSTGCSLRKEGGMAPLFRTQSHASLEGRPLVRWGASGDFAHGAEAHHGELVNLYPEVPYDSHRWGMAIDLDACIGCAGCSVACQSENNIPVVGPEQVGRGREMSWIRVDRYYEGPPENPVVLHQPMLCQHCGNAPCENVCPVNATTHSPEGLNQMAYNRCVGTRYCANNCPYKVRRFNFFNYEEALRRPQDLALNPEVSVRPRGVMEKCTFCVQRIQDAKQVAKAQGRPLRDGEFLPACAAACPTEAIRFGDLKDPESRVSRLARDPRGFKVLEDLGVLPAVTYLARVVNAGGGGSREGTPEEEGHHP